MKILAGLGMEDMTQSVCERLDIAPTQFVIHRFPDGELRPQIEENIRGDTVFIIQTTHPHNNLIALLLTIDALKRSSASRIIPVIPYFAYGRQERKDRPRVPISAALWARCIVQAGATDVVCVDMHAGAIQGFFSIPCDHLYGSFILIPALKRIIAELECPLEQLVVVAPDKGRFEYNAFYANRLGIKRMLYCGKRKTEDSDTGPILTFIEGELPRDAVCIMCDDMVDTAKKLTNAARAIKERGAQKIIVTATHPILSPPALERIHEAPIDELHVTDTIPLEDKQLSKIRVHSITPVLAEAIKRINGNESISSLFEDHFNDR